MWKSIARMSAAFGLAAFTAACEISPEFDVWLSEPGDTPYEEWIVGQWYMETGLDSSFVLTIGDATLYPDDSDPASDAPSFPIERALVNATLVGIRADANELAVLGLTGFASEVDGKLYYNFIRATPAADTVITPSSLGTSLQQASAAMDYTANGETAGNFVVRLLNPTPDTMLVCILMGFSVEENGGMDEDAQTALDAAGMTVSHAEGPLRVNGQVVRGDPDATELQTKVHGDRSALRGLIGAAPAELFDPVFVFSRLGKPYPEDGDKTFQAQVMAFSDECDLSGRFADDTPEEPLEPQD